MSYDCDKKQEKASGLDLAEILQQLFIHFSPLLVLNEGKADLLKHFWAYTRIHKNLSNRKDA